MHVACMLVTVCAICRALCRLLIDFNKVKILSKSKYISIIIKKVVFFLYSIRMSEKNIILNDKKIDKNNFYKNKKLFIKDDIDIKILKH